MHPPALKRPTHPYPDLTALASPTTYLPHQHPAHPPAPKPPPTTTPPTPWHQKLAATTTTDAPLAPHPAAHQQHTETSTHLESTTDPAHPRDAATTPPDPEDRQPTNTQARENLHIDRALGNQHAQTPIDPPHRPNSTYRKKRQKLPQNEKALSILRIGRGL